MRAALVEQTNITADEVIAQALSIIKGRSFGGKSTEVAFLRQWLANNGFDITRRSQ